MVRKLGQHCHPSAAMSPCRTAQPRRTRSLRRHRPALQCRARHQRCSSRLHGSCRRCQPVRCHHPSLWPVSGDVLVLAPCLVCWLGAQLLTCSAATLCLLLHSCHSTAAVRGAAVATAKPCSCAAAAAGIAAAAAGVAAAGASGAADTTASASASSTGPGAVAAGGAAGTTSSQFPARQPHAAGSTAS